MYPQPHPLRLNAAPLAALPERLSLRHSVHAAVHGQDDGQRDVEGAQCREQSIAGLLGDAAHRLVFRVGFPPAKQGAHGDDRRESPESRHGGQASPPRGDGRVAQRVDDGQVAVDGDHAQAEDGGGAAEDVQRRPGAAEGTAEHPPAERLRGGGEGQDGGAEQQVRRRQVGDEVVRHGAPVAVEQHRQDDQDVAEDPEHDKHHQHHPQNHRLDDIHPGVGGGAAVGTATRRGEDTGVLSRSHWDPLGAVSCASVLQMATSHATLQLPCFAPPKAADKSFSRCSASSFGEAGTLANTPRLTRPLPGLLGTRSPSEKRNNAAVFVIISTE